MIEVHDFAWHTNPEGVVPECSCDWSGEVWEDFDDALLEWEDHTDDVFYRATTLDADDHR